MNVMLRSEPNALQTALRDHIGRHVEKSYDWDAFPSNRGFPKLERAQMRFIGSGGSPKVGEKGVLKPEHFTLSLVHQPVGNYAACHAHEIEEGFLILQGVLTVGWEKEGDVVEVRLGPKDMIFNAREIPHGFRNEGVEPVLMSIMVGAGKPLPPRYVYHPKNTDEKIAEAFGATEGHTLTLAQAAEHPIGKIMVHHVIRYAEQPTEWLPSGIGRKIYVGEGGAPPSTARKEMIEIPRGVGINPYVRDVEDAYLVLEGCVTVGWEENGVKVEERLGPKDVLMTPAGRPHYFRNDDMTDAQMFMAIGTPHPDGVEFVAA